jgi:hypothetical protein
MLAARRAKMDEQRNLRFIPGYVARISIGSCEPSGSQLPDERRESRTKGHRGKVALVICVIPEPSPETSLSQRDER